MKGGWWRGQGGTLDFECVSPGRQQVALQVKGLQESVERALRSLSMLQELETDNTVPRAAQQ